MGLGERAQRSRVVRETLVAHGVEGFEDNGEDMPPTLTSNTDRKATVYSTIDGEPREILLNDLDRVIQKRLPDGRYAFWMEGMEGDPPEYVRGNLKCFLHPEFDEKDGPWGFDHSFLDEIGIGNRTCNMGNAAANNRADFKTVFQRTAHERSKHRDEYATVKEELERRQAHEDRMRQERQLEALLAVANANSGGRTKKAAD